MTPTPDLFWLISSLDDAASADARSAIEQLRNLYSACLNWSTRVVVVGLLFELPEIINDVHDLLTYRKRGYIPTKFRGGDVTPLNRPKRSTI